MKKYILFYVLAASIFGCDTKKDTPFESNVKKTAMSLFPRDFTEYNNISIKRIDTVYVDIVIDSVYIPAFLIAYKDNEVKYKFLEREMLEQKAEIERLLIVGLVHDAKLKMFDLEQMKLRNEASTNQLKNIFNGIVILRSWRDKYYSMTGLQCVVINDNTSVEKAIFTTDEGDNLMKIVSEKEADSIKIPDYLKTLINNGEAPMN